jgi:uncharacterized membrane protein (UPF0127 family)
VTAALVSALLITFPHGTVTITRATGSAAKVRVEIAETPAQQARGLMFRRRLAPRAGMVFVFPSDTRAAFWMKNTRIPLSIAFYGSNGRILRMMDMPPCRVARCPSYDPKVAFRGALEVNRGAFRRWNVHRGDTITLTRDG